MRVHELRALAKTLNYFDRLFLLWRARTHYLRRRRRLIPLYGTLAAGPVFFF
jgi:hypothetical protein